MNRCWLCIRPFAKGKQKKVFQVSNIINFFQEKTSGLQAEDFKSVVADEEKLKRQVLSMLKNRENGIDEQCLYDTKDNDGNAAKLTVMDGNIQNTDNGDTTQPQLANESLAKFNLPDIKSMYLRKCFVDYCRIMSDGSDEGKRQLAKIFVENEIEMWMSGLVCNNFALCNEELAMFLSGVQKKDKSELDDALEAARGPGYCPPGCGCDNPWSFLGSMK